MAAKAWFSHDCDIIPEQTFQDVFEALKTGRAQAAVVAVENSNYGPVTESLQLLELYNLPVIGEIELPVHQQLITLPGATLATISQVYSHPVALGQSNKFLEDRLPRAKQIEYYDTAAAVRLIKAKGDSRYAAIASRGAADIYDMPILAENIETDKQNITRFVIIQP